MRWKMALVLDIPFARLANRGNEIGKRCMKIGASGQVCGRETEGEGELCAVHGRWSDVEKQTGFPFPDDAMAVQEILARTTALVAMNIIFPEKAQVVIELCRLMMRNLRRM
jgi:hypothetical protein